MFGDFSAFAQPKLMHAIDEFGDGVHISMSNKPALEFTFNGENNQQKLSALREFLTLTV